MFATLLGDLPRPPLPDDAAAEALLDACLQLQIEHGLEPLTDGGWPVATRPVTAWTAAADRAGRLVKAVLAGPWTSGRTVAAVRRDIEALADAGCVWIEIHEPAAATLGAEAETDDDPREAFAEQHRALTDGLATDLHLSLAIVGGAADAAGIDAILAGSYSSLALDLIDGPDNWRLAVAAPGTVGIVCGAVARELGSDDAPEILVWAANYAATTGGRGIDRVGLATAGSLAALGWDDAVTKVRKLGDAARIAAAPPEEQRAQLDPRAYDIRSAALGRNAPPRPRRARRG